ncbi:MAG: PhnD/SsuA/transferrin family substrate-binding protein [Deltaproteobacteria bacterium]|nr:PhnD/SsuA/transferrin family substrate-binding protein [Deltaproteobacteria bacterium]
MKLMPIVLGRFKLRALVIAVIMTSSQLFLSIEPSSAAPVRVAYSAISGAMGPLWVAHDLGIFSRHGVDVQLLYVGGGSVVMQTLLSGDVQFVRVGANAAVQASLRGAELKMIANTINRLVFSLMSRPEIKSSADLKGKKIGVTRLGGSTDFALDLALKKWGLRRGTDVAVIQTGGMPQLLGAITGGNIDAGVISPPTNLQALKLGLKELVDFGDLEIPYPNSPIAATQNYLTKNRDLTLRFLRGYSEGIHRVKTDRESTLRIFSKYTRVKDPEILAELYRIYGVKHLERIPFVNSDAVNTVLEAEAKTGSAKAADFIDNSFISEIEREGLFRQLYAKEAR